MRTKILFTPVGRLTKHEAAQLSRLTFGKEGMMYWRLRDMRAAGEKGHACRMYDHDGLLVAWVLVFRGQFDYDQEPDNCAYIYTRAKKRRRGWGTRLMKAVEKKFGNVTVFPHDKTSYEFFDFIKDEEGVNITLEIEDLIDTWSVRDESEEDEFTNA